MAIFPLAPDQTVAQMWSNGVRGGGRFLKKAGRYPVRPISGKML